MKHHEMSWIFIVHKFCQGALPRRILRYMSCSSLQESTEPIPVRSFPPNFPRSFLKVLMRHAGLPPGGLCVISRIGNIPRSVGEVQTNHVNINNKSSTNCSQNFLADIFWLSTNISAGQTTIIQMYHLWKYYAQVLWATVLQILYSTVLDVSCSIQRAKNIRIYSNYSAGKKTVQQLHQLPIELNIKVRAPTHIPRGHPSSVSEGRKEFAELGKSIKL